MNATRTIMGAGLTMAIAVGLVASPTLFAQETAGVVKLVRRAPVVSGGGIGSFTPASADPRMAAIMARTGINTTGFRFTPTEGEKGSTRAVTVAVRARTARGTQPASPRLAVVAPAPTLTPIAYNLGVSVGWKRFAVSGDLAKLDLAGQPGSRERVGLGVSYRGRKAAAGVTAASERPLASEPKLVADAPNYSIDVGGSYKLTRNLDVTAGVRYRTEKDRLLRMDDNRRDSQAVYVGTAFRF